jgi:hypothetical protein
MLSYREFIEGYESPEYSENEDEAFIDTDIKLRVKNRSKNAVKTIEEVLSNHS